MKCKKRTRIHVTFFSLILVSLFLPIQTYKKTVLYSFKKIKIEVKENNPAKIAFDDLAEAITVDSSANLNRASIDLKSIDRRLVLPILNVFKEKQVAVSLNLTEKNKTKFSDFKIENIIEEIGPRLNRAQKIRLEEFSRIGNADVFNEIVNDETVSATGSSTQAIEGMGFNSHSNTQTLKQEKIQGTLDYKSEFNSQQKTYTNEPERKFDKVFFENLEKSYREKMVASRTVPNKTIFFGRATYEEKPLQNAVVKMDQQDIDVVYLNETFLPDLDQKSTASHGYFAFFDVPNGLQTVRWEKGSLLGGYENVLAEQDKTTEFNVAGDLSKRQSVYSFDAFSQLPVSTTCFFQGTQDEVFLSKGVSTRLYTVNSNQHFSHCKNEENDYVSSNFIHIKDLKDLYLPQISKKWLSNLDPNFSMLTAFIGFVPNLADYEIYLNSELVNKVTYFDNTGAFVDRPTQGGGFYISRKFENVLKLKIKDKLSEKTTNIIIPSEEGVPFIHVFDL